GKKTVLVFERHGASWELAATLAPAGGSFGISVATDGSRVFVGDDKLNLSGAGNPGAVWVFEKVDSTWTHVQTLFASDAEDDDQFGRALDTDGVHLIVGAPRLGPPESGSAYVFERQGGTWVEVASFGASDAHGADWLGADVGIDGGVAVVGAPRANGAVPLGGAAYVLELVDSKGWQFTSKLVAPGSAQHGRNVAIDGGLVVCGGIDRAVTYVPVPPFWVATSELVPSSAGTQGIVDLDVDAGRVVLGLPGDHAAGLGVGSVLVFEEVEGTWTDRMKLLPADPTGVENLGERVALDGDLVAAGAPFSVVDGGEDGLVFLFSSVPNAPAEYGAACSVSSLVPPHLGVMNSYDGCFRPGGSVTFELTAVAGSPFALLLVGMTASSIALPDGCSLLVDPASYALTLPVLADGTAIFGAAIPTSASSGPAFLQAFVADSGAALGFVATNGVRLVIGD
ncbi:MAG: hypothetical protein ACF8XB_06890, partial [Planctomycetota bacterium JB042]